MYFAIPPYVSEEVEGFIKNHNVLEWDRDVVQYVSSLLSVSYAKIHIGGEIYTTTIVRCIVLYHRQSSSGKSIRLHVPAYILDDFSYDSGSISISISADVTKTGEWLHVLLSSKNCDFRYKTRDMMLFYYSTIKYASQQVIKKCSRIWKLLLMINSEIPLPYVQLYTQL